MIIRYVAQGHKLVAVEAGGDAELAALPVVWIDALSPRPEEMAALQEEIGVVLPTPDEMSDIEVSSRLYQEGSAQIMTTSIVYRVDTPDPTQGIVTFALLPNVAVTLRYSEPRAFHLFAKQAMSGDIACHRPEAIVVGLLEAVVERQADLIERMQGTTELISKQIFQTKGHDMTRAKRHAVSLKEIGKIGVVASRVREGLVSQSRLLTYFRNFSQSQDADGDPGIQQRIKTTQQDVASLAAHTDHISQRLTFLMDATIGLVGIEQNQIIKLFSVVAVMLMPPTLIASVYGMNFQAMPELHTQYGYPVTLGVMAVSAILPFLYFRHKGWL